MNATRLTSTYFGKRYFYVPSCTDGTKDMAPELEGVIEDHPNAMIDIVAEVIYLRNCGALGIASSTRSPRINVGRCRVLQDNDVPAFSFDNTGNVSSEVTVSAVANETINSKTQSTKITIGSTLSAEAHDWIALYSEDANPSKSGGKLGEIHQLIQDESSLDLNTTGVVGRASEFTTTVRCRKLDSSRKLHISGGVYESNGDADDVSITTRSPAIKVLGFVDPYVENVVFDNPWAQGVWMQCCAGGIVNTYEMRNALQMAAANGFSYGVVLYGMNGNCTVRNGTVRNCRHPAGTTDGNSGGTTTWYHKGYPTYGAFLNTRGYNCYGTVLDTHEEGFGMVIDGVYVHNAVQDEAGNFVGRAFQGRSAKETVRNVIVYGGSGGIVFDDIDHGFEDEVILENYTVRDVANGAGNAYGVELKDNAQTNKRMYRLDNIKIHNCERGIDVGQGNKVRLGKAEFERTDICIDVDSGSEVNAVGQLTFDFENTGAGSSQAIYVRSDGVSEPTVRVLVPPVVIQGASNAPNALFDTPDANNKNVWHPTFTNFDNGFTATSSKNGTGWVNLADVNSVALA